LHLVDKPGSTTTRPAAAERTDAVAADDSADTIVSLLDGRQLIVRGTRWTIELFSVCCLGGSRYVQLCLRGPALYLLTLRIATDTDLGQMVPQLLAWLMHPTSTGEVLNIR
jgi:hypothetical protein